MPCASIVGHDLSIAVAYIRRNALRLLRPTDAGTIREDAPTRYAALGCEDGVLEWLGVAAGRGRWRVTWWFNKHSRPRALTERALDFHGNSRASREAKLAGLNRRMRKTARTVVWED